MFNEENNEISFRVAEKTTYGGAKFFVPQIKEDGDWCDIDFDGDEYSTVADNYGDLKCETFDQAVKSIKGYCKEKEEELRDTVKATVYHDVTI
jgi:hypothetical protein